MKGVILLTIAIFTEVFATTMLKFSEGFTMLMPSIGVIIGYGLSFYCLSHCLQYIPLSLAYAIWSGVGTALTTIIGIVIWNDPFNSLTVSGILLIIGGVILLNSPNSPKGKYVSNKKIA